MNTGYIYEFRNTFNNKYYVGQTTKPRHRYLDHKKAQDDSYFHRAIRKYGFENFEYTVVEEINASDKYELKLLLNDAEVKQIELRDSYNNGYNLTVGGGGILGYTFNHSDETKEKMRKSHKGKAPKNIKMIAGWNKGKPATEWMSESGLNKIRTQNIGRKHSEEYKQSMKKQQHEYMKDESHRENLRKLYKGKHWKLVDGKRVWY